MSRILRLGTRASALAMAQSRMVAGALTARTGVEFEFVQVTTHGDVSTASLASLGGTGAFATALREALLAGECDLVVHSLKDLPTASFAGLTVAAIPVREDARDALVTASGATLGLLGPGARIGTGSPRRGAQVRERRPDVAVLDIRGNVDTRIGKVLSGEFDAVVLAAAGLARLGLQGEAAEVFSLESWPTAAGQGALGIEVRVDDADVRDIVATVDDAAARLTASAERAVLATLEAGCAAPVGVSAAIEGATLTIRAAVYGPSGASSIRRESSVLLPGEPEARLHSAVACGRQLANDLIDDGAAALTAPASTA